MAGAPPVGGLKALFSRPAIAIRLQFEGRSVKLLEIPVVIRRNANFTDATRRISYLLRTLTTDDSARRRER